MRTAVSRGAVCWNGGTFYGSPSYNSLHLIHAYFAEYPEDAAKVVISIKGPIKGDETSVRRTVDECLSILDGKKRLNIFQCARVDPKTPIEDTMSVLARYIEEDKLDGISLSEPTATDLKKAAAVHRIACIEVEFSLYALEMTHNGIAETCAELGIPIIAYSPLGRGFLVSSTCGWLSTLPFARRRAYRLTKVARNLKTGNIQRADELPDGDVRKPFPRIQPGAFELNMRLAEEVRKVAEQKGCSISQVALAWVKYHTNKPGFPEILPIPGATTTGRIKENTRNITLTEMEYRFLSEAVHKFPIVGTRYP